MKKNFAGISSLFVLVLLCGQVMAQVETFSGKFTLNDKRETIAFYKSDKLGDLVDTSVKHTLKTFQKYDLKPSEIAVTVIDLSNSGKLAMADYRGEEQIYPASVVKMFYLAAFYRLLEDGTISMTPELERGLKNMIIESGNESTGYILDVLTDTTSGPELTEKDFAVCAEKRNSVNRYFESLGYKNININQKTHCEDAWGREQQFRGYSNKNRNLLTSNASARLMAEIALGRSVTPDRSQQMMELLRRDWEKPVPNQFYQEFISHALKPGTKLWSKEGYTSQTRHDAAYIETPEGLKFVIAVFTENHSDKQEIIPSIARSIIKELGEINQ